MTSLLRDGYRVHRGVFSSAEIEDFRSEANQIATKAGSACVRRRILHFEYAPPDALDSRLTWNEILT